MGHNAPMSSLATSIEAADIRSANKRARALRRWAKREQPLKHVATFRGVITVYLVTVGIGLITAGVVSHIWRAFHRG